MADDQVLFSPALDDDVLVKAKDEIARFHELRQRALEGHAMPEAVNQGCDITLSHMSLSTLPPELIDIIKNEVSRLALDHNRLSGLSGLSMRFSECLRLRYLVMRNNQLREFPPAILSVPTLELLDLRGNKIESLPEDLSKLRKLRVFSIHHNRIFRIPLCVGQMNSLVHFTTSKNPISFPPTEEWMTTDMELRKDDKIAEDARIRTETKNLKNWLAQFANRGKLRVDGDLEMSEDNVETPRPARRKTSGRFPIKPSHSGTDLKTASSLVSPALISPLPIKPPPIPSRSFARLPTQPQTATFRPTIQPIVTLSERNRSNSESQMSTSLRSKRMGMIPRKPVAASGLDLEQTKRLSHLRGLSHGSAMQNGAGTSAVTDSSSPGSPVEADPQRVAFVRRLSSLPEGKRKSHTEDPLVDVARGVLYALDQVHTPIKKLLRVLKDGKRSHLERTCQVAFSSTEELDRLLSKFASHDEENEEDERRKSSMAIRKSSEACIRAFEQLIVALQQEVRTLVIHSNPQYIRTLMHLLYASLVELRNACAKLGVELQATPRAPQRDVSRGRFLSPAPGRPLTSLRVRDREQTILSSHSRSSSSHGQRILPPRSAPLTAASRTGSMTSMASTATRPPEPYTPFSNGSISTPMTRMSRSNTLMSVEEVEEEQQFEFIFVKLTQACDFALQALPRCHVIVTESQKTAADRGANEADLTMYAAICDRCRIAIDAADALKKRLGTLQLKEPGIRVHLEFWHLCTAFIRAYTMFAARVKDCWHGPVSLIPDDVKFLLKPVQRSVKEVSKVINDSPWCHLAATPAQQPSASLLLAQSKSTTNMNTLTHIPPPFGSQPQYQRNQIHTARRQQTHPQLSLSTRGAPPPNPLDPLSAASTHSQSTSGLGIASGYVTPVAPGPNSSFGPNTSFPGLNSSFSSQNTSFSGQNTSFTAPVNGNGAVAGGGVASAGVMSGYVTPLAATPMSAALGPAAGVTVPLPVSLPLAALAASGGLGGPSIQTSTGIGNTGSSNINGSVLTSVSTSGMGLGGLLPPLPLNINPTGAQQNSGVILNNGVVGGGVNVGSGLLPPTSIAGPSSLVVAAATLGPVAGSLSGGGLMSNGVSSVGGLGPSLFASLASGSVGIGGGVGGAGGTNGLGTGTGAIALGSGPGPLVLTNLPVSSNGIMNNSVGGLNAGGGVVNGLAATAGVSAPGTTGVGGVGMAAAMGMALPNPSGLGPGGALERSRSLSQRR